MFISIFILQGRDKVHQTVVLHPKSRSERYVSCRAFWTTSRKIPQQSVFGVWRSSVDFQRGNKISKKNLKSTINTRCLQINDLKNRIANLFIQHGFKHGDKVALLMENRPEFVAIWLGLSKIGIVIPLINHNLRKQSLLHSVTIANCTALIYCESLVECEMKFKFILL